jgi:hypothetical protein
VLEKTIDKEALCRVLYNTWKRSYLPSVKKSTRQKNFLPSVKKILGKELLCRIFFFTE